MANRNRRLQKEIADIQKDSLSGISITAPDGSHEISDFTRFKGQFDGPPDTPYEGGHYEVDVRILSEYPFKPPQMRFITKIWHPNVSSQTGAICLDTLSTQWTPILTLKNALISLQSLLSSPEPKDPQDAEVASMLISRPEEFKHVAREWAQRYAGAAKPPPGSANTGASSSGDTGDLVALKRARKESERETKKMEEQRRREAYRGYNEAVVDRFTGMGFRVEQVVNAFEYCGMDTFDGEEYEMEEGLISAVTARLFGEM